MKQRSKGAPSARRVPDDAEYSGGRSAGRAAVEQAGFRGSERTRLGVMERW